MQAPAHTEESEGNVQRECSFKESSNVATRVQFPASWINNVNHYENNNVIIHSAYKKNKVVRKSFLYVQL